MTDKKHMIIDGQIVNFDKEQNILAVIRKAGIDLPTFCYYSELSIYGACRMCVVEDEWGGIIASCSTPPRDEDQDQYAAAVPLPENDFGTASGKPLP
jgi:NADH-quinone oxidoreductase subunit G